MKNAAHHRAPSVVLGSALRLRYPDFNARRHGFGTLKQFIDHHAKNCIVVADKAGQELVYGIASSGPSTSRVSAPKDFGIFGVPDMEEFQEFAVHRCVL